MAVNTPSEYQAEWDAESLAQAEEIKADSFRYDRAKKAALKIAEKKKKEFNSMQKVSNTSKPKEAILSNPRINKRKIPSLRRNTKSAFNVFKRIK